MKITWLGQAGFLLETSGLKIIIDPYLSESCLKLNPDLYRRMPIDEKYLEIEPDVIIITHDHLDHYDPETLKHYLNKNGGITYDQNSCHCPGGCGSVRWLRLFADPHAPCLEGWPVHPGSGSHLAQL